jgi:predicted transcriptional regulator
MGRRTRQPGKRPTDSELEILQVIWSRGPSTVRQVHDALSEAKDIGATTVLKLMQIMTDKGLLHRDESVRPQVFAPARTQRHTQRQMLGDLVDRAFGGSPGSLVLQALSSKKTTPEERERIRRMLDELEEDRS